MTVTAAIFDGPGRPLRFEHVPKPVLQPGEALVRVSLCTVCGSDLHTVGGKRQEPTPCVLGHEVVGVVEETAGAVRDVIGEAVRIGDRVVWSVAVACGGCFFCARGLPQKCEWLKKYGHARHDPARGPSGGFASHVHLWPGTAIVKVPDAVPDAVAAVSMCATATVAAVVRAGGPAETAVVFGAGMLGLTACAMAAAGGGRVVAVDQDSDRRTLGASFGAIVACEPDAVREIVAMNTDGRGVDVAYECSGSPAATRLALDALRVGGTLVLAGAVFPTEAVPIQPEVLIRRLLTVRGMHNYTPDDLRAAMNFLAAHHGRFPFAELVSKEFPLSEIEGAMAFATREKPVRVGLRP